MSPATWCRIVGLCGVLLLWALVPGWGDEAKDKDKPAKKQEIEDKATFSNSVGMKFVRVKAGSFTMGSPKAEKDREPFDKGSELRHEVEITRGFFIGVTEVTQKQFREVMGFNPSYFSHDGKASDKGSYHDSSTPGAGKAKVGKDTDDFPVENVSWEDAQDFLKKLNALAAEKKHKVRYRLPTEAEWEYACRGGPSFKDNKDKAQLPFHFKAPSASLGSGQANFDARYPCGEGKKGEESVRTNTVGGNGEPNALGLVDMHGNVFEWCSDWYAKDYYGKSPKKDPPGPDRGSVRVFRGGGWDNFGLFCRAAYRGRVTPSFRHNYLGFRVAAVPHE